MNKTPQSNRLHVSIFGETNSGKSSLFNAILGTDTAIVSEVSGTTTDPVTKSMELIPYGPIVLIDTAGINDKTLLGSTRMEKTRGVLDRTDFGIYAIDINNYDMAEYKLIENEFIEREIPYIVVFTKKDTLGELTLENFGNLFKNAFAVSINDSESIAELKSKIASELKKLDSEEETFVGDLVPSGGVIVTVIPVDSEAPKGRIILPQVQLIRDCLDHGIRCNVTTELELSKVLAESERVDLVVTDSQAFKLVNEIVPKDIPLTGFSILMARQKGDIKTLIDNTKAIANLKDGSKVLISEVCTHTKNHEDIGAVKIPKGLEKVTGKKLDFTFINGRDYPNDLDKFDLIIHCGGCMITKKEMGNRINTAVKKSVPITNYGLVLAYINGIFDRSIEILDKI